MFTRNACYDLFRDDGFEYIGTTRAPEGAILMAGDSSRVGRSSRGNQLTLPRSPATLMLSRLLSLLALDLISRPWCGQCALSASWLTTARGVSNSSMADKPIGFALRSLDVSVTKWQIHPTASILRLLPTVPTARRSIK